MAFADQWAIGTDGNLYQGVSVLGYNYYQKIAISKWKAPENAVSIVGIQPGTASLRHIEFASGGTSLTFTTTIFDTTTRADSARLLLTNSTGVTGLLRNAAITAKVVTKLSGQEGYLHDAYVDYESIAANGEMKFELGNDFVCTFAQVNKLADYHWKNNKTKRHVYTVTLVGMQSFFEPGEWYTLTVGSAGTAENVSSVCECYSVRCGAMADAVGQTVVALREMYQNWTFDSNETARSLASGKFDRFPGQLTVTVASSTYMGTADYYCDGTADDVEINAAIPYLAGKGGGIVQLTEGTFNLATFLEQSYNNIWIVGMGRSTILTESGTDDLLHCIGLVGTHISGCGLANMQFNSPHFIKGGYSDGYIMEKVSFIGAPLPDATATFFDFIQWTNSDALTIRVCLFDSSLTVSSIRDVISIGGVTNANISNNVLRQFRSTNGTGVIGIVVSSGEGSIITSNQLFDFSSNNATGVVEGIQQSGNHGLVSGNRVEQMKNSNVATKVYGIYITGTSNTVSNNYCYNNGSDTGIANTNGNNFTDGGTDTQYAG